MTQTLSLGQGREYPLSFQVNNTEFGCSFRQFIDSLLTTCACRLYFNFNHVDTDINKLMVV